MPNIPIRHPNENLIHAYTIKLMNNGLNKYKNQIPPVINIPTN